MLQYFKIYLGRKILEKVPPPKSVRIAIQICIATTLGLLLLTFTPYYYLSLMLFPLHVTLGTAVILTLGARHHKKLEALAKQQQEREDEEARKKLEEHIKLLTTKPPMVKVERATCWVATFRSQGKEETLVLQNDKIFQP